MGFSPVGFGDQWALATWESAWIVFYLLVANSSYLSVGLGWVSLLFYSFYLFYGEGVCYRTKGFFFFFGGFFLINLFLENKVIKLILNLN